MQLRYIKKNKKKNKGLKKRHKINPIDVCLILQPYINKKYLNLLAIRCLLSNQKHYTNPFDDIYLTHTFPYGYDLIELTYCYKLKSLFGNTLRQ